MLTALLVVGILFAFLKLGPVLPSGVNSADPGPLSVAHASFRETRACHACHEPHGVNSLGSWVASAFTENDPSSTCLNCHIFDDSHNAFDFQKLNRDGHVGVAFELSPNEANALELSDVRSPRCAACHLEHRGSDVPLASVQDVTCQSCHVRNHDSGDTYAVNAFPRSHPAFENFPYRVPNSVRFDHFRHLNEYFDLESKWMAEDGRDRDFAALAAKDCTQCHAGERAGLEVPAKSFRETCSRCHLQDIRDRPLVVFDREELTDGAAALLGLSVDIEETEAQRAIRRITLLVGQRGPNALEELAGERAAEATNLFLGLPEVALKTMMRAWVTEDETPGTEHELPGQGFWTLGETDDGVDAVQYNAEAHYDPILIAWMTYIRGKSERATTGERVTLGREYLMTFLDPDEGPGACGKCHSNGIDPARRHVGDRAGATPDDTRVHWGYRAPRPRPYTQFAHQPHLAVLGPDKACKACHSLVESDYGNHFETLTEPFVSNFAFMTPEQCARCHEPGRVSSSCQQCHSYHLPGRYKETVSLEPPNTAEPSRSDQASEN